MDLLSLLHHNIRAYAVLYDPRAYRSSYLQHRDHFDYWGLLWEPDRI